MNGIDDCCKADKPTKTNRSFWVGVKRFVMWRGYVYRITMRMAHKFNWHYAPPVYPDGDTQLWCQWCGFRQTIISCDDNFGAKQLLKDIIPQSHFIDIRIRLNGKYYWFEGDFLKQIFPHVKFKQIDNCGIKTTLESCEEKSN